MFGYRVKVVRKNIRNSFPNKSDEELKKIESSFYHHFTDYIVETLKLTHISREEVERRAFLVNPEVVNDLIAKGHSLVILLMGHYANWEWFTGSQHKFTGTTYQIYRPLNNRAVDRLFIKLRTRFGAKGIKKNDTVREMVRLKMSKKNSIVIFLADQTPSHANLHYWTDFLNQDSAMITGPERLAQKLNAPVVFCDVKREKRGYYKMNFDLITEEPKEKQEYWITEQYARKMDKCIMRDPSFWLWTHKRWKHEHVKEGEK